MYTSTSLSRLSCVTKLLSRCSHVRLCNPIDGSPPGSPVPGILQAMLKRHTLKIRDFIKLIVSFVFQGYELNCVLSKLICFLSLGLISQDVIVFGDMTIK